MRGTRFNELAPRGGRWLWVVPFMFAACSAEPAPPPISGPDGGGATVGEDVQPEPEPDAARPSFVDAQSYFQEPAEVEAWYRLLAALRADFDAICGDTFCEGDFSNYESLRFRCSVESTTAIMGECVWVFGASNEEIAPETGKVGVDGRVFACLMPIAPGTDIRAFVAALSTDGDGPLQAPLPGTDRSLYDGLGDCL